MHKMTQYIDIPRNLDRKQLVSEFGMFAVNFYEERLKQRVHEGRVYLNPIKTIYLWAWRDRNSNQGFYTTFKGLTRKRKTNYGGS